MKKILMLFLLLVAFTGCGKKVLDENVRTFLQFKGGVNKGMRDTIEHKPEYFFAYNNGITATAKSVVLNEEANKIIKIRNLQIVNGGQTTSSIYRSKLDLKRDVSDVIVKECSKVYKEHLITGKTIETIMNRHNIILEDYLEFRQSHYVTLGRSIIIEGIKWDNIDSDDVVNLYLKQG